MITYRAVRFFETRQVWSAPSTLVVKEKCALKLYYVYRRHITGISINGTQAGTLWRNEDELIRVLRFLNPFDLWKETRAGSREIPPYFVFWTCLTFTRNVYTYRNINNRKETRKKYNVLHMYIEDNVAVDAPWKTGTIRKLWL